MIALEIANIIRHTGDIIVVTLIILSVFMFGFFLSSVRWKRDLISHANTEAQDTIRRQRRRIEWQKQEISRLNDVIDKYVAANKAGRDFAMNCRMVLEDLQ